MTLCRRNRVLCAVLVGLAVAPLPSVRSHLLHGHEVDVDQMLAGARFVLAGRDPYALVGPQREFDWPWPLYYPGTTIAAFVPLALVPVDVARGIFVGLSGFALALALSRDGWWRLAALLSPSFALAAMFGQLAPLICAAILWPGLAWVVALKPTTGLLPLAAAESRRPYVVAAIGSGVLLALSLALMPSWPMHWWRSLRDNPQFSLLGRPLGWLILLAVVRWRRPEARMLVALSLIPHTVTVCETLYLLLIPRHFRTLAIFCGLSFVTLIAQLYVRPHSDEAAATMILSRQMRDVVIVLMYLPALAMILSRPNVRSTSAQAAAAAAALAPVGS